MARRARARARGGGGGGAEAGLMVKMMMMMMMMVVVVGAAGILSPPSPDLLPSMPKRPPFTLPAPLPPHPSITLPAFPPTTAIADNLNPGISTSPISNHSSNSANDQSSSSSSSSSSSASSSSSSSSHLTIAAVLAVFVTVSALSLLCFLVYLIKRQKQQMQCLGHLKSPLPHPERCAESGADPKPSSARLISGSLQHWSAKDMLPSPKNPLRRWFKEPGAFRRFRYAEIKRATDDLSSVIGKGGFGTVYKARFGDGSAAAVKRMARASRQRDNQFCREMEFLGRLHHRHLVTLRGFCITRTERFLVYEFMENGSLNEHLQGHSKTPLSWDTRIQIAIDVAAALEYLHFFCDPPLCHRDIKSSNILLDQHFSAKVADFGLAHATPILPACNEDDLMSTDVRGTPGYLDPEYVVTRQLTVKSDIYSYGVLLLELVTGRAAVQDHRNLVAWAQPYLASLDDENGDCVAKLALMADPAIQSLFERGDAVACKQLLNIARLIRMCTAKEAKARPSIRQVLALLYEIRHLKLESEITPNLGGHSVSSDAPSHQKPPRFC